MSREQSAIRNLKSQIERATAVYDWQTVFQLVAEGLAMPGLSAAAEYDLRAARMLPNWFHGDLDTRFADAEIMLALARETGDIPRLVNALHEHHWTHHLLGEYGRAQAIIEDAYALVKTIEDAALEARTLNFLGTGVRILGDVEAARGYHQAALELSRKGVSPFDESWALEYLALVPPVNADPASVDAYLQEALTVAHEAGTLMQEMSCLNTISGRSRDFARTRFYKQRARQLAEKIDMPTMLAYMENSLGFFYWQLGLFGQAARHAAEAVRLQRKFGFTRDMMMSLDTLGWIALDAGDRHLAKTSFEEILNLAPGADMQFHRQGALAGLGRLALANGHLIEAESFLKEATAELEKAGRPGDQAVALATLALVYLEEGDAQQALDVSAQAIALAEENAFVVLDSPVQNLWWLRYDVLARAGAGDEKAWEALEAARLVLFDPVANISDEGLRRNYLSKPPFNRAISEAWAKEATRRDISLAPFTERETTPAALTEQLQRIVESGARLAAERDADKLAEFILQEFVELSGVERAVVALRVTTQNMGAAHVGAVREPPLQWAATEGIDEIDKPAVAAFAAPFMDEAALKRAPVLVDAAGNVPANGIPELHLRSVLVLPLVSQGKLWGVLYGDMRHLFGRLNENDRDILSLLANQAGAAVENANWVTTLEQQVEERTAELRAANEALAQQYGETAQRNAELAIINSVQEGLASQLTMPAIYDLVGDKIREIFKADTAFIAFHDEKREKVNAVYYADKDHKRPFVRPYGKGLYEPVVEGGKALLIGTSEEALQHGGPYRVVSPDAKKDLNESFMGVPIFKDGRAIGATSVQSYRQDAYDASDLRLLTTLTNSMSVALENARLFDEAQRLFKAEQERVAELQIINSIQQGLVAKLDFQSIIDLIGEEIRQLFLVDTIFIALYNEETKRIQFPYYLERSHRITQEPFRLGEGLTSYVLDTRRPLLINENAEQRFQELSAIYLPNETPKQSWLGVPIVSGNSVIGTITLQDVKEDAFQDSDIRLLTTVAASMGVALENAQLFDETQRLLKETEQRASELAVINTVSEALVAEPELDSLIQLIGDQMKSIFNADIVYLALLDRETDLIHFPYQVGENFITIDYGEGLASKIIETGEPLLLNRDVAGSHERIGASPVGIQALSYLGVPIKSGRETIGVLSIQSTKEEDYFDQNALRLLTTIAANAGAAINTARLYREAREAERLAEKANQAKSTFLAAMSHELRTPLNAIIGFTRIVRRKGEGALPARQLDNLEKVLSSSEHLLGLINTVLDIAKIEAGRMDVYYGRFPIGPLIETCATTTQPLLRPGVRLALDIPSGLPDLNSDQDKVRQILLNLLSNAAKFTHAGTITMRAGLAAPDAGALRAAPLLTIEVIDTGIGMNEEQLGRVFEEFQQADSSTTREYGGTGLGLPISKHLAGLLGGDLTADSQEGQGSTFRIWLPLDAEGTRAAAEN